MNMIFFEFCFIMLLYVKKNFKNEKYLIFLLIKI